MQSFRDVDLSDGVDENEAKTIAQDELLRSPGNVYTKVLVSEPTVVRINWKDPKNKEMKDKVIGYYERFQENWLIRFPSNYRQNPIGAIGCQVWVSKKDGAAQISCAPIGI